jgi:hypothetical protein
MLLPAIAGVQRSAKRKQASVALNNLVGAINAYNTKYSRLPSSTQTRNAISAAQPDYIYGTTQNGAQLPNAKNQTDYTQIAYPGNWQISNAELMAILLNEPRNLNNVMINNGFELNPQKEVFLSVRSEQGPRQDRVSDTDGAFRDPWGYPYIVILDLDYDGRIANPFAAVTGEKPFINASAIAYSLGADGKVDFTRAATGGAAKGTANADNIYSWRGNN